MVVLAIDSSANSAGVSIVEDEKILCDFSINAGLTHSQTLMPLVETALKLLPNVEIDKIAVTVGPGSFTGVRIAVASAKGLAMPKNTACVPISSLEALAYNAINFSDNSTICTVLDARCKRAYYALFEYKENKLTRLCEDNCLEIDEIKKLITKDTIVVGDCADKFENYNDKISSIIKGSAVAFASFDKKEMTAHEIEPKYLQLPQAQRERIERLKKEQNQ